jgi:hypothetical protein
VSPKLLLDTVRLLRKVPKGLSPVWGIDYIRPALNQTAELVTYPTKEMVGRIKIPLYLPFAKGRQYYISLEIDEGLILYQPTQDETPAIG